MANEIELNEKIRKLIMESGMPSQEDLKQVIEDLLMYMKHEEMSTDEKGLGHEPIFNNDFPGDDDPSSLFKRINWRADLDEGEGALDFDNLLENDKGELNDAGIWNESVKELIKYFKDYFVNLDEDKTITVSGKEANGASVSNNFYIIRNILKANAGNHFKMVESKDASSNKWTLPHLNIDNISYGEVRGNDKILEVLENAKNLDFTHTQGQDDESTTQDDSAITKYIRLLMPKYIRRVEVEDLNRNFWVIGQVLSIVCAALFDGNSPIPKMLKQLSSETLQLWENVLYLWAAVNLLNEKQGEAPEPEPITEVHREIIDYPRAIDKPFRDIHSFVDVPKFTIGTNGKISEPSRLVGYKQMYPESNLCLLIRCRLGNYEKEYYHTEVYPYVVFYDVNIDQWYAVELKDYGGEKQLGITLRINSNDYTDSSGDKIYDYINIRGKVYGITETFPTYYRLYYPLSKLTPNYTYYAPGASAPTEVTVKEDQARAYHGMISIKPSLTDVTYSNGKFSVKIEFTVTDIARKMNFQIPTANGKKPGSQTESQEDDPNNDSYIDKGNNAKLYLTTFVMTSSNVLPGEPDIITSEDISAFIKGGNPFIHKQVDFLSGSPK